MGDRIAMSQRERDVLKVMEGVLRGDRSQVEAARLLRLSVRQVRRIQRRLEAEGDEGVVHRHRGRVSNHRISEELRGRVLRVYRREYGDFGPTLASEKLSERGLSVSSETLRRWLMRAGLWQRKRRRAQHRERRARRACFGELVQMDTSIHAWTEGRGESMVLVAMIDDATGRILTRFYAGETLGAHFDLLRRWLGDCGRPLALYADRDSIFQPQAKGKVVDEGKTQFGRALEELEIELIPAYSPQAKGRVERLFGTLQDRWVKELRLAGVRTIAQANALLEDRLLAEYNRRFAVEPASSNDAHRRLGRGHALASILSVQSERRVSNDYVVRLANRFYQLHKPALPGLRGGTVVLEERLDGTLAMRFRGRYLKFHEIAAPSKKLPSDPGSLTLSRPLAGGKQRDRACSKTAGATPEGASRKARSGSAKRPAAGRSGRTPAEPYPPDGEDQPSRNGRYRPPANHPWRRTFLSREKEDISIEV